MSTWQRWALVAAVVVLAAFLSGLLQGLAAGFVPTGSGGVPLHKHL